MEVRQLFGGAIRATLPSTMRDESLTLPAIPDHQEVFVDAESGGGLIVEIVEHNTGEPEAVCRLYVDDLAQLNEATSTRDFVCEAPELVGTDGRWLTCGCSMDLPKDGIVSFRVLILQLPEQDADILCVFKMGKGVPEQKKKEEEEFEVEFKRTFNLIDLGLFR